MGRRCHFRYGSNFSSASSLVTAPKLCLSCCRFGTLNALHSHSAEGHLMALLKSRCHPSGEETMQPVSENIILYQLQLHKVPRFILFTESLGHLWAHCVLVDGFPVSAAGWELLTGVSTAHLSLCSTYDHTGIWNGRRYCSCCLTCLKYINACLCN